MQYNTIEVIFVNSKNIIFVDANNAQLISEEVRMPAQGEVLVKLCVSTISSGTERANLTGCKTVSWITPDSKTPGFPRRSGYSSAGIVEQVGEGVTSVKVGDRVALSWSTHNQYVSISERNVYPIGDLPFEDAALFHISTFPLAAIRKCRLEIGESAIIMGLGVLGLVAIPLLKTAGAAPIIAVDPVAEKRQKALELGADYVLDPYDADFAKTVKEITDGGAKVGIEVTGVGAGLNGILDCMARFGRVALLGCTRNSDFTIDYYRKVHGPGITLIGAHTEARPAAESHGGWWTQRDDVNTTMRLTQMGRLKLSDMIDETYSPEQAHEVYTRLATESSFPLVQFDWRRMS